MMKWLFKESYRRKQKEWAERLARRIQPSLPLGVYVLAAGWMPGCEPMFQVEELEWVLLTVEVGPNSNVLHYFYYPEQPTSDEIAGICNRLLEAANGVGPGIA